MRATNWLSLGLGLAALGCIHEHELDDPGPDAAPASRADAAVAPASCTEGASVDVGPATILASAPLGIGVQHLGRPVDQHFVPIVGPEGDNLFPEGDELVTQLDVMEHHSNVIENEWSLRANASVWGIVSVEFGTEHTRRYAAFRAHQIADVHEIDDATPMRAAPPHAAYYVSRVFLGHSYEAVVHGEARAFHAGVSASFLVASGSIDAFAERHRLSTRAFGRGLRPSSGEAIFARTAEEIEAAYSASGPPVPILVEYRRIPSACLHPSSPIRWVEPTRVRLGFDRLHVYRDGSAGASTWSLRAHCSVNGQEVFLDGDEIWDYKKDVKDNCTSAGIPGPNGSTSFCNYDLYWSTRLDLVAGDELACGVEGMSWDRQRAVDYAEFRYFVQDDNEPATGHFGNASQHTEYWMFYSLEFTHPDESPM
jgi:hypothetical protein